MTASMPRALFLASVAALTMFPALAHETGPDTRQHEYFQPGAGFSGLPADDAPVPFHKGLAGRPLPVTTASTQAQAYFNQGMALRWGFNHAEAIRSFRAAQSLDPTCAMCFWGEALALGPNINDTMANEAIRPAWIAMQQARSLSANATERERALIDALSTRYGINATVIRSGLDHAWADAIGELAARWPGDAEILTLHADALMNLQPRDYWDDGDRTPKGRAAEIVTTLERAIEIAPDHIGALNLYIHAVEASAGPS